MSVERGQEKEGSIDGIGDCSDDSVRGNLEVWIVRLQARMRGELTRKKWKDNVLEEMQKEFGEFDDLEKSGKKMKKNQEILRLAPVFLQVAVFPQHLQILACLVRHMILSMDSSTKETNFASILTSKSGLQAGNRLITNMFRMMPTAMHSVTARKVSEQKAWQAMIHWMIVFSGCGGWSLVRNASQVHPVLNSLCNKMSSPLMTPPNYRMLTECLFRVINDAKPLLSSEAVNALFTILLRPLKGTESISDDSILLAADTLFTCPAVLVHVNDTSREMAKQTTFLTRVIPLLNKIGLTGGNHSKTLNLMGNLVHLSYLKIDKDLIWEWAELLGAFIERCSEVTASHSRGHVHWHPVFGSCSLLLDAGTEASLRHVMKQLRMMWSKRLIGNLFEEESEEGNGGGEKNEGETNGLTKLWKKFTLGGETTKIMDSSKLPISRIGMIAHLFSSALFTLPNLRSDILAGLCSEPSLISRLWRSIQKRHKTDLVSNPFSSNSTDSLSVSLSLFQENSPTALVHLAPLHLFAETATFLIKILDDEELYEQGIPLSCSELVAVARFCNLFCFRAIWNGVVEGAIEDDSRTLFASIHGLCMLLYGRNSRRPFTADPKFWIPGEVRSSVIISEFEKASPRGCLLLRKMSHVVPIKDRLLLFRKYITNDKSSTEGRPRLITVDRSMIVEDGFKQLSRLSSIELRSTIRVKFVNQQGLDEAGIDQDGVFKEFLELTLKAVFNPNLSLFSFTSAGQLHPSTMSYMQENHLDLFRFVGKMLAKAVYEGIVVDVQLAPVMLATLLGEKSLCAFDELAQFDPELYRSLSYVKKGSEDEVNDMGLTFSTDENCMGKLKTIDIVPCGRAIQVTHENRINYVHRMAHYRVFTQTKEQCKAFVEGFQKVANPSWLFLFAPHELQYLISGQSSDIDLADLRKHVQYYGGFHSGHRLIKWLWQILENDFSAEERRLFLKFVTSCSRGPLLGFGSLEPPFSIRCVEVSDDQDTGDTLGSVVRGFLALKKGQSTSRLPTASTCFNLLKLPNYNKKSVLLEKLRYAIHSETGFELS
ncbi:oxi-1 [Pristionchus pacificus]|nr:oxi-1 [Pristionchus pacificus]